MWALGSKSLGAVSIAGGGVGACQHLRMLSIQADFGSPALPYKASLVYVSVHLPAVLLDLILHAQSFRLFLVSWTKTHNVENIWPGSDLSICPPLALDFHSKSWGLSGSPGKDLSVWTRSSDLPL